MARFNILRLFDQYGINYVKHGANTARGNVNVSCPWCRDGDPSEHLGVKVTPNGDYAGAFGCWRSPTHRGKNAASLIAKLVGISYRHATELVGDSKPDPSTLDAVIAGLKAQTGRGGALPGRPSEKLVMPKSFKRIKTEEITSYTKPFYQYLRRRGFPKKVLSRLIKRYDLRYTLVGPYKGRIIIPIKMFGELVSWTARDITGDELVRYKTLTSNPANVREGEALGTMNIKHTLYSYDHLIGGRSLYIVEGPLDCLKLDVYSYRHGINAVAVHSNAAIDEQIYLLNDVMARYDKVFILLDDKELSQSMRMLAQLRHDDLHRITLNMGVEDPGDLSAKQVMFFLALRDSI
jgi:hypothetical protein|tara:strand:- start:10742 stop:11788 length:1047 start_codon:yes stop_codon:yes gene_type:complete